VLAFSETCPLNQVHLLLEEKKGAVEERREVKHSKRRKFVKPDYNAAVG